MQEQTKSLDTRVPHIVRVENAALDESYNSTSGLVMRGRISASSLRFLKVDPAYQRDLKPRAEIQNALRRGQVLPDIDIGVRGLDYNSDGDDCLISEHCYIIDGWQRVGNALQVLEAASDLEIRIGALLHFGTTQAWEAERFTALNTGSKRVSSNLHLRNLRNRSNAVLTLYGLTYNERNCPLYERICWSQSRRRGELVNAFGFARVISRLHAHKWPGRAAGVTDIAANLDSIARMVSLSNFRQNCLGFVQLIEECWGIRSIEYSKAAPQIRQNFLMCLASVLSRHSTFWSSDGTRLSIDTAWRRKFARFAVHDPYVCQLASAAGSAQEILHDLIVNHMESGQRANRLTRWPRPGN